MKEKKRVASIRLDDDLKEKLEHIAKKSIASLATQICKILRGYVNEYKRS